MMQQDRAFGKDGEVAPANIFQNRSTSCCAPRKEIIILFFLEQEIIILFEHADQTQKTDYALHPICSADSSQLGNN